MWKSSFPNWGQKKGKRKLTFYALWNKIKRLSCLKKYLSYGKTLPNVFYKLVIFLCFIELSIACKFYGSRFNTFRKKKQEKMYTVTPLWKQCVLSVDSMARFCVGTIAMKWKC